MEEKLRPVISNNEIINLSSIINEINNCKDENLLKDYKGEVEEFSMNNSIKGLSELELALENQIEKLNLDSEFITEMQASNLISAIYDGMSLTEENEKNLHSFIINGLNKMEEEVLDYDYQNVIDMYIVYLEDKENLALITLEEKGLLNRYRNIIQKREKQLEGDLLVKENPKKLKLLPSNLNTNGAVVTIVILEVTMLLGMLMRL